MHGNTRTIEGLKTRMVGDIVAEIRSFFQIARAEGVHPGGMHLEMTGGDVTECIGGSPKLAREDLGRRYLTHCDPRLNERQALDVAQAVAELLSSSATHCADAA
jgi:3-deoxy-7-phosphoheptulonate synthase